MKNLLLILLLAMLPIITRAQSAIKFEKTTYNFGTFSQKSPIVKAAFSFTNTGNAPLIINQAVSSTSRAVAEFSKKPIQPGETGTIMVTYNGKGTYPGHFKKAITIRSNGSTSIIRLYIEGDMVEGDVAKSYNISDESAWDIEDSQKTKQSQTTTPTKITQIPNLVVVPNSIAFKDVSGTNAVIGGKSSTITLKVQNTGKGNANNCQAKITAKGSTQDIKTRNIAISHIAAGETKTIELPITAGMNTQDGQVEFAIQVDEPNGFGTDPQYLTVQTKAFEAPLVKVTDYSLTGNSGSTLKKKQPFDLQLMLQNTNYGQADNVSVSIDIPQNVLIFDGGQQQSFASLKGGETKSLIYSLIVNNNYQGSTIPIKVHVKEKYGKYAEDRTINLTLDQALASTKIDVKASQQQPRQSIAIASIGSDVDKEIPTSSETQQKTFVVIIANEHYQMVDGVPFANNDGAMFEAYCRQTLGIPQKNIRMVKDATLNGMKYQIGWLKKVMIAYYGEASAIVYYAGHGIPDEQSLTGYLLPTDGYTGSMSSAYSIEEFYRTLSELPAQSVTVFLDACFSGTKRDGSVLANARGVAIKAKTSTPQGNMIVFSAAQGDETAYPYNEQEHGMFTYYLLKKLKESKGNATLGDLSDYIIQEVSRQSIVENSKSQTPTVIPSPALQASWRSMKLK
mgnify:CR=1 FL=1